MHLPRQTDRRNRVGGDGARRERGTDRFLTRAPPIGGILLGPGRARRGKGCVIRGGGSQETAVISDNQRARTAGADVNA